MVPRGTLELEAEIERLRASLAHAQRLATLGTVASLIAHEFNNILTPVLSYSQMALAEPDDRQLTTKALERASQGTERASEIAAAILDFAKADLDVTQAGSRTVPTTDVQGSVTGMLNCLARDPRKDGIRFGSNVPRGTFVNLRPIALQQVLLNLVLNARRAVVTTGKPGSIQVSASASSVRPASPSGAIAPDQVSFRVGSTDQQWITISVADTGCGVDSDTLRSAFNAFVSCSASSGTPSRGTGLGLTVCQQLIAQAGGFMWATSTPGKGSTFAFAVPGVVSAEAGNSLPREARAA